MSDAPDLSRLTDAERRILALLAEGHTAKTIAVELGRSENAVNERLREARRKTGVGSSRALARLLRARENRDEDTGMAAPTLAAPTGRRAPLWARWQGVSLVSLLIGMLVAASVALTESGQQVPAPSKPAASDAEEARIRATFAAEKPNVPWANGAAAVLARRYRAVAGQDLATLSIECRTTLCWVRGQSVSKASTANGVRISAALASPEMGRSVPGFHADVTRTGGFVRETSYYVEFEAIWRRLPG